MICAWILQGESGLGMYVDTSEQKSILVLKTDENIFKHFFNRTFANLH